MKKITKIFIIVGIVFLAASCGKAPEQQTTNQQTQTQQSTSSQPVLTPQGQTQTKDNANGPDYFPNGQKPGGITVTQTVEGSSSNKPSYQATEGQTAFDLLDSTHTVQAKDYSGIGKFVETIDGVKPDSKHFWAFYVNGKSSNVGASSYVLKNGDKIEWKLELIK